MLIKKSQAILKRLYRSQLQSLVYAGLRSRNHGLRLPVKVLKTLNDRQSGYLLRKFHNNPAKPNYHMSIKESQAKCTENIGLPVI